MTEAQDPHASKISPDDPRLRLRPSQGRTLRRGPAIAVVIAVAGTVTISLIVALVPMHKPVEKKSDTPPPAATSPTVPDAIRNAPDAPSWHAPTERRHGLLFRDGGVEDEPGEHKFQMNERDPNAEQQLRARGAGILFEGAHGAPANAQSVPSGAASAMPVLPGHGHVAGGDADPNLQGRKNAFLDSEGATKTTDTLRSQIQHPQSPYEIQAGTVLPAILITAMNSDLPGPVIGQIRENVYDTVTGNYLLVPQGSRIIAEYDSMVAWGQERVLVCWNRLIFPNGDSLRLECMPAADLAGAAGLADDVNEHWVRIIKGAAVASLLAATTQAVAGNTDGVNPTIPQMWARGGASEMNQAGQSITQRNLAIQPTITVRPGFSINVVVTKDMVLPGVYTAG